MSLAYFMQGNVSKADAINTEIIKNKAQAALRLGESRTH